MIDALNCPVAGWFWREAPYHNMAEPGDSLVAVQKFNEVACAPMPV